MVKVLIHVVQSLLTPGQLSKGTTILSSLCLLILE